ncbi:MAG: hypothetical protein GY755_16980 [Chloroflexi bacterium]|nr:hypothetical protein [Chloroflexota bacterium]
MRKKIVGLVLFALFGLLACTENRFTSLYTTISTEINTATLTSAPTSTISFIRSYNFLENCDAENFGYNLSNVVLSSVEHLPIDVITPPPSVSELKGYFGKNEKMEDDCFFTCLPGQSGHQDDVIFWHGKNNTLFWQKNDSICTGPHMHEMYWWTMLYGFETQLAKTQSAFSSPIP